MTAPARKWLALLLTAAAVLAASGYFVSRWLERGAEKRAALARAETARPADALPPLHAALAKSPDDAELLAAVVKLMIAAGSPVADVEPFAERWCRAAPDDPEPMRFKLDLLKRLTRQDEAAVVAERLVAMTPNDHGARAALAGLYLNLGRFADAAAQFRTLLAASPSPDFKMGLARALSESGDPAAAGKLLDEVLTASPDSNPALILRGLVHVQAGEFEAGLGVFRRAAPQSQHQHELVQYHIALCLERTGRADDAKKAFAALKALQEAGRYREDAAQRPDDVALQLRAADALLAANRADAAREDLEAALARRGPHRELLLALAKCYDALGRTTAAADARARARAAKVP